MGLWSWLRDSWSGPSRPRAARLPPPRPAPAPAPDPGWRALPPVQRTLGDGAQPVARLGDFAGSLATWQSPRMLTGLEHGRGPSAPQGTVAGIVDAVGGAPGLTSLPASPVPSSVVPLLGGSSRGAAPDEVVQRSVRFDRPGGAVQRALSDLRGTSTVVQRAVEPSTGSGGSSSSSGVSGVSGSAPVGVSPTDPPSAADVGGGAAARAGTGPYGAGSSGSEPSRSEPSGSEPSGSEPSGSEPSGSEPFAARPFAEPADSGPSAIRSSDFAMPPLPGETGSTPLAAQRSVADAGDPVTAAPTLGATPLQRTLADPPAPVGPAGQALPQLPVVPEQVVARSFVTAPPPPTARPALPVVAGSSAGEYLQRSAATSPGAPATSASASATPTTRCPRRRPHSARARQRCTGCSGPEPGRRRRLREAGCGCVRSDVHRCGSAEPSRTCAAPGRRTPGPAAHLGRLDRTDRRTVDADGQQARRGSHAGAAPPRARRPAHPAAAPPVWFTR